MQATTELSVGGRLHRRHAQHSAQPVFDDTVAFYQAPSAKTPNSRGRHVAPASFAMALRRGALTTAAWANQHAVARRIRHAVSVARLVREASPKGGARAAEQCTVSVHVLHWH